MYAVQRQAPQPRPRWLFILACLFVWTSTDGNRQCPHPPTPAPRAIVRTVAPPPRPKAPAVEFYYPAEPAQPSPAPPAGSK